MTGARNSSKNFSSGNRGLLAARERDAAERLAAAVRACRDRAFLDAALCPSRLSAFKIAREGLLIPFCQDSSLSKYHGRLFLSFDVPFFAGSLTPARRAFESPITIACLVERVPACLRERARFLLSRILQPACSQLALHACLSLRSKVSFRENRLI
jgi:hypothetical protein